MENYTIVKAPNPVKSDESTITIFMAGSIDNGSAVDWYGDVIKLFEKTGIFDRVRIQFLNPRRDSWDASMEQAISNPEFSKQVKWELDGIRMSDVILFYFAPNSLSPVTMLECGVVTNPYYSGRVFVYCPEGFWRKGNIDFTCRYFGIPVYANLEDMVGGIASKIRTTLTKIP